MEKIGEEVVLNRTYPCSGCKCFFFTKHDLQLHLKAFGHGEHGEEFKNTHKQLEHEEPESDLIWMKSKFGDGANLLPIAKDPKLAHHLRINGPTRMGNYMYDLSFNGKWITKKYAGAT